MSEMTITNPAAQEQPGLELRIFKHNLSTRIMHLCVAIGFMYCGITGLLPVSYTHLTLPTTPYV